MAALTGLLHVDVGFCFTMSGGDYMIRSMNEWFPLWQANRWRKAGGKRAENVDLWQALVEAVKKHRRAA